MVEFLLEVKMCFKMLKSIKAIAPSIIPTSTDLHLGKLKKIFDIGGIEATTSKVGKLSAYTRCSPGSRRLASLAGVERGITPLPKNSFHLVS